MDSKIVVWKKILLSICLALAFQHSLLAHAADDAASSSSAGNAELANPFSDYVPFQDEYDVDEDERFMYFGRYFAVQLGTGLHQFTGNIGKLYNTAIPVLYFNLIYFFDFRLAGQIGVSNASHAFNAAPAGLVEVNLLSVNADLKYYFSTREYSAAITSVNPYLIGGLAQTFRTQTYQTYNGSVSDTAFAASIGAGLEFTIVPRKTSLSLEGRIHDIFFKDRDNSTYIQSGIPDTTGYMYSLTTDITFYF